AREQQRKDGYEWWSWLLSILTVGALALQAIILAVQASLMKQTVKVSENATQAAKIAAGNIPIIERAYLNVEPRGIEIDTKKDVIGQAAIVNKGRVPARKVSIFIRIKWDADENLDSFGSATIPPAKNILPVGAEMPTGTNALTDAERANFQSKQGFLY